jgi:hypothetical protein
MGEFFGQVLDTKQEGSCWVVFPAVEEDLFFCWCGIMLQQKISARPQGGAVNRGGKPPREEACSSSQAIDAHA